jgi:hypothetical protein
MEFIAELHDRLHTINRSRVFSRRRNLTIDEVQDHVRPRAKSFEYLLIADIPKSDGAAG